MAHHFSSRTSTTQRLLCLLLCVAAWRGPVPVLHQHESLHGDTENFARHLQSFHESPADCADDDWHWHLVLPDQPAEHDGEPAWPEIPAELTAAFAVAAVQTSGGSNVSDAVLASHTSSATNMVAPVLQRNHPGESIARSFLQSFARSVPMRALTGVALC